MVILQADPRKVIVIKHEDYEARSARILRLLSFRFYVSCLDNGCYPPACGTLYYFADNLMYHYGVPHAR